MSDITDNLFDDVCLDERVTDGIFRMDEETHMDALRDRLVKKGIPTDIVKEVTNKMLEGQYPDRQAWRTEDGILVTWATPERKKMAMQKFPGKYTDQQPPKPRPNPSVAEPPTPKPETPTKPAGEEEKPSGGGSVFNGGASTPNISQGGQSLEVEPPQGVQQTPAPIPSAGPSEQAPKTPQRIAAEKEVVKQIFATDDHALANITPPMSEQCRQQLNELYKQADKLGFKDAITFLTPFIKP